jgi:hypothetical protein
MDKLDPTLLTVPCTVRSSRPLTAFRDFIAALEGRVVEIRDENSDGLSLFSSEFGFQALSVNLADF